MYTRILIVLAALLNTFPAFSMETEPLPQQFLEAINRGDKLFVEKWATNFTNIKDSDETTALMHAVERREAGMVTLLIEKGADVKAENKNHITALMIAALKGADEKGNNEIFNTVLKHVVDLGHDADPAFINKRTHEGVSALDFAILGGNEEIVDMLIQAGAEFNTEIPFEWTLLKRSNNTAINKAIIKRFLQNKGDIEVLHELLLEAAKDLNGLLIEALLSFDELDINTQDNDGNTVLMILANKKIDPTDHIQRTIIANLVQKILSYDYYYGPLADTVVISCLEDWFGSENVEKVKELINHPTRNKEKIDELETIVFPDYEFLAPKLYANITKEFAPDNANIIEGKPIYEKLASNGVPMPKRIIDFTVRNKAGKAASQLAKEAGNNEIDSLIQKAVVRLPRTLKKDDWL